jgi:hypothetical protein
MTITWVPVPNSGVWKNGVLVGEGSEYNEIDKIYRKGNFNSAGELEGANCTVLDFSDPVNINIRKGPYAAGKENGTIAEYVLPQSNINNFETKNAGVDATKYGHTFSIGVYQSTTSTESNIKVRANKSKGNKRRRGGTALNNVVAYEFSEV